TRCSLLPGMSLIDLTPPPTICDRAWQLTYRVGFPMARSLWRLWRREHVGALVAIYVGRKLLLVASSYRPAWNFPGGGVHPGETPAQAAQRETLDEIGLAVSVSGPAYVATGRWEGRADQVHIFEVRLDQPPSLRLDNREIIAARLFNPVELGNVALTGPVKAYVTSHPSGLQ
ncbi:MAG TPA: NUDIX hydrolase, partial [Acetobacteraceae bacterium]|nr:NUDIX hydrolase [Acetobacteraceae bacterium]